MPIYEYECPKCHTEFDRTLKFSQYKEPQVCPECGMVAEKIVSSSHFVLKGDGWPGKDMKVTGQMKARRKKIEQKEKDHVAPQAGMKLVPNVRGEITDSWSDAKKLAASKGKDSSSYDFVVQKEKRGTA